MTQLWRPLLQEAFPDISPSLLAWVDCSSSIFFFPKIFWIYLCGCSFLVFQLRFHFRLPNGLRAIEDNESVLFIFLSLAISTEPDTQ